MVATLNTANMFATLLGLIESFNIDWEHKNALAKLSEYV